MLNFPRWKIILILSVCLISGLLALPNILAGEARNKIVDILHVSTVNLGLDLRGGSYLLLEVDFDKYLQEQLQQLVDDTRIKLREQNIGYQNLEARDNKVVFILRDSADKEKVSSLVSDMGNSINLGILENNNVEISYKEQILKTMKSDVLGQSIETVRRRVDETGTREPIIQRQGDNRILLQVPGLENPEKLKLLLGKTAKMTFHLMDEENPFPSGAIPAPAGTMLLKGEVRGESEKQHYYLVKKKVELSGDMLVDARASYDEYNRPSVTFRFNTVGAKKFGTITQNNVGNPFAIVLDGKVITSPVIQGVIAGGNGQITGNFTTEEANNLALLLRSGALPAPLKVIEERTVGPSLGKDSIEAGKKASILGVVLVMVFMVIFYGLFGLFANIALILNIIMLIAALSLFQATLTLPGIAGIVLTIGMAVDANVIIFERIKDEIALGRTPYAAIDHGFRNAFSTIFDSNLTTLLATTLLFIFGTGPVKGFAVTLTIGVLASMFTAILLTRMIVVLWLKKTKPQAIPL